MKNFNLFTAIAGTLVVLSVLGWLTEFRLFDRLTYDVLGWLDDDGDNAFIVATGVFPFVALVFSYLGVWLGKRRNQATNISEIVRFACFIATMPYLFLILLETYQGFG